MIKAIINGIFKLVMFLINALLLPIDLLIANYIPDLQTAINAVYGYIQVIENYIGFAINIVAIDPSIIRLLVIYYIFKLTVPQIVAVVKLCLKWYNTLKL